MQARNSSTQLTVLPVAQILSEECHRRNASESYRKSPTWQVTQSNTIKRVPKAIRRDESVYPEIRAVKPTLIDQMKKPRDKSCYPVPGHGRSECGFG